MWYTIILMVCFGIAISQEVQEINFKWVQFNDRFDCIASISADGQPVSTGVFISTRTLLTSANPLQEYIEKNSVAEIKIHTIHNVYNFSKTRRAESLAGNQSYRQKYWVTVEYDEKSHTTIHDILLINLVPQDRVMYRETPKKTGEIRRPFAIRLPFANWTFLPPGGAVFAGFGYIDENHITDNTDLEVSYYEDSTFVDCDEWIPREWGRFICLMNEENLAGVASGMPLFHSSNISTVLGIGCFALQKGDESVLIFTDLRPYVDYLYGYIRDMDKYG